jgi:chitinase
MVPCPQFAALKAELGDAFELPPKRILATTFIPSAWVDDKLIAERTAGLTAYLAAVLATEPSPLVAAFLAPSASSQGGAVRAEDALPSTLSQKDAPAVEEAAAAAKTYIAASYYPDWSIDSNPPENIDFSKFDIIFFGSSC